eukprot:2686107-Prymnesium_polylepis.1
MRAGWSAGVLAGVGQVGASRPRGPPRAAAGSCGRTILFPHERLQQLHAHLDADLDVVGRHARDVVLR